MHSMPMSWVATSRNFERALVWNRCPCCPTKTPSLESRGGVSNALLPISIEHDDGAETNVFGIGLQKAREEMRDSQRRSCSSM